MKLVQETGGVAPGAVYAVDGNAAVMVWSPHWRSDVPTAERMTQIGEVGRSTYLGWPSDVTTVHECPMFKAARIIAEVPSGASQRMVEDALLRAGLPVTPLR